jgi:hypothetical protein
MNEGWMKDEWRMNEDWMKKLQINLNLKEDECRTNENSKSKSIKIEDRKIIKKSIKTCFGKTMFQMKLLYTAQWMKDEWTMNDEDWNRS